MGTFTMPLWEVISTERDAGNGLRIGLSDYPLFDASYRDPLNRKIINHFWNREIGLETISMFTFNLRRKMWEIMPLYNQVYKSTQIEFDPLSTYNLTTVREDTGEETGATNGSTGTTANTNSASRTVNSDTPQTQLSQDEDYATSGTDANSSTVASNSGTQTSNSSRNNTLNGNSHTTGYQGSAADLLLKYRATLLNTDMMVIAELNELFFGLYDNGDELLPQRRALSW